jgi:hypothetical protein
VKEISIQNNAQGRARKGARRKGNQKASALSSASATADSPTDLPEALQPPERFATTSEVARSLSPSPKEVDKPILVEESDQEQVMWQREGVRPRRNHQRPK